jgi:RNA polymerase sigma-70 factor, ECF subfamily
MAMSHEIDPPFEALYATYALAITRYLAQLTGSREVAEDLTQDTFLKALRHWGQRREAEHTRGWLFRIATNTAYDELRRRRRQPTTPLTERHAETLATALAGFPAEESEQLWTVIGQLPVSYRVPLVLQGYAGYALQDIADMLGWKVGTVKSRLHRARALFQRRYLHW